MAWPGKYLFVVGAFGNGDGPGRPALSFKALQDRIDVIRTLLLELA